MQLTGAEIITEVLIEQGVTELFGYPGGAALNIYDALYAKRDKIHHYLAAHEQGATHAADGYARATGKTGVVIATSGPGATNTVTGIATAALDSSPLVVITANVGTGLIGRDSFQEVYIAGITQPITKHNYVVRDVSQLADILRSAFNIAGSGRKGPVLVDVPKDITAQKTEFYPCEKFVPAAPESPEEDRIKTIAALINESERPVVCVGGGVIASEATDILRTFVASAEIPTCHTIMGTGVIGYNHPQDLGMLGMHGSVLANRAVDGADLLLAIGMRFSDRVALNVERFAPAAKIVQIDIDPSEIAKNVATDYALVSDIRAALTALLPHIKCCKRTAWETQIASWRKDEYVPEHIPGRMRPHEIMNEISRQAGDEAIIVTDVGQHQMWAAQFCGGTKPRGFLTSGGLGTMGFGYGAAIGAKVGVPDATVIHVTGDGSFHMNLNEACTAVSYDLPIITVIMNNGVLGMVRQWQAAFYDRHYMSTSPERKTDYVKVAEGFGAAGYRAETLEEFQQALSSALAAKKPAWIDCRIDKDEKVLPMIPSGMTVDDIIVR